MMTLEILAVYAAAAAGCIGGLVLLVHMIREFARGERPVAHSARVPDVVPITGTTGPALARAAESLDRGSLSLRRDGSAERSSGQPEEGGGDKVTGARRVA
jgi:hypothetical protein